MAASSSSTSRSSITGAWNPLLRRDGVANEHVLDELRRNREVAADEDDPAHEETAFTTIGHVEWPAERALGLGTPHALAREHIRRGGRGRTLQRRRDRREPVEI